MYLIYNELVRSIEQERCKYGLNCVIVGIEYLPYKEKKNDNLFLLRVAICDVKEHKTFIKVVQTSFTEELILRLFSYNDEILSSLMYSIRLRLPKPIKSWNMINDLIEEIFRLGYIKEIESAKLTPENEDTNIQLRCIIKTHVQEYYDKFTLTSNLPFKEIQDDIYLFSEVLKYEYNRRWKEKQLWDMKKCYIPSKE